MKNNKTPIMALLCAVATVCVMLLSSCGMAKPLTLSFDLNGGVLENLTDLEYEYGDVVDLTEYAPTRDDYIFKGWSYNGNMVTEVKIESDATVTATWEYIYEFTASEDGLSYAFTGIKTEYEKETLVLPEEFEGKKVTLLKAGALDSAANVKTLVIGNGYTEIEKGALAQLAGSQSITLPFYGTAADENYFVTLWGSGAEADDNHYIVKNGETDYVLPNSLKTLKVTGGDIVPDIKNLKIENFALSSANVTEIPARAFNGIKTIKSIDLSGCKNIEKIGDNNFSECDNLKSVNLNGLENLKVMGAHSFYYYVPGSEVKHEFEKIDLGGLKSLETIGQMSFWYVIVGELDFSETAISAFGRQTVFHSAINSIKLPAAFNPAISDEDSDKLGEKFGLTYLNNSEFLAYCEGLAEITVDKLSLYAAAENGVLYDYEKTVAVKYAAENQAKSYVAPATLKKIVPSAFENAENLEQIDLSACTLESIGYNAFGGCSASLTVGFDKYGYYAKDGSKISLANGWKGSCTVTYGERYLFFTIKETGISDGLEVADATYSFDITATYGDDKANVTVTFNGETITRGENGYTVTLNDGENTITAVASFGDKTSEVKTYVVTLEGKWTLKTNFAEGKKIVWAASDLEIIVSAYNASNEKQKIENASMEIDCGYSAGKFVTPGGNGFAVTYNADGTATITVKPDNLLMWDYAVTDPHHIRITVKQSENLSVSITYDAQYFEDSAEITSQTPVSGNTASGNEWSFDVGIKSGRTALKIASVKIECKTDGNFFENSMIFSSVISADGLTATIKADLSIFGGWGYVYDGDSFDLRITVTTEDGLTATKIFTATYSE